MVVKEKKFATANAKMIEGKKFFKSWALVAQRLTSIQAGLCEDRAAGLK